MFKNSEILETKIQINNERISTIVLSGNNRNLRIIKDLQQENRKLRKEQFKYIFGFFPKIIQWIRMDLGI